MIRKFVPEDRTGKIISDFPLSSIILLRWTSLFQESILSRASMK